VPREGLQHEAIENEREFFEMSSQQEALKKKAAIQRKINERRIDDMQHTQESLREKFIAVNTFLKECIDKTARAETQISEELQQQAMLSKKIEIVKTDMGKLSVFEVKFKEILTEFQMYEDIFNEIIAASEFESFDELMSRCDSLSNAICISSSGQFAKH
jgi:hypothetical protein